MCSFTLCSGKNKGSLCTAKLMTGAQFCIKHLQPTTPKVLPKQNLFLELSKKEGDGFISTDKFTGQYEGLRFGNGGSWARRDSAFANEHKLCTVSSKETWLSWEATPEEKKQIELAIKPLVLKKGNKIRYIKSFGLQSDPKHLLRAVRQDIKDAIKQRRCVNCGTSHDIEVDHKNGLYNNPRVLNTTTQTLADFQALCKKCNCLKRQAYIEMEKTGIRPSARIMPQYEDCGFDYTRGDATWDPKDIDAMVGTYWYDPVDFAAYCRRW